MKAGRDFRRILSQRKVKKMPISVEGYAKTLILVVMNARQPSVSEYDNLREHSSMTQ